MSAPVAPAATAEADWRRTMHALTASVFVWFAGTNFTVPFMPIYVRQLGSFAPAQALLWTGLIMSSTPLASGLTGPLWGMLADRFGRRIMLQRSLIGFTAAMALLGVATSPWHLLAIMAFQGLVGGFSSGAVALATSVCPPEAVTMAVGRIQAARVLGLAIGPLPGGVLADTVGIRVACVVSACAGAIAFATVTALVPRRAGLVPGRARTSQRSIWGLLANRVFLASFVAVLFTRIVERTFDPVLPSLIGRLPPTGWGIATTTGVIASCGLFAAAVAAVAVGRLSPRHVTDLTLSAVLAVGAVAVLGVLLARSWLSVLTLRVIVGLVVGAGVTLAFTTTVRRTPSDRRGATLGLLGAGISYGSFLGFIVAAAIAPLSLNWLFTADSFGLMLAAAAVFAIRGSPP